MAKTNTGLVAYAKAQLGKPYWYGCYGQKSSATLYATKKKQYPNYYTANNFSSQYGVKVHDCVGLIKGYLWCDSTTDTTPKYNAAQDVSANGMLAKCSKKGAISTMPDVVGTLVFMDGHVGVYIGGGYVIEAMGHAYGVVKTKLAGRGWKNWGYCPYIDYETKAPTTKAPTTKAPAFKSFTAYVTASSLNVRSGAKIGNNVIGSLVKGKAVKVIGKSGSWYKINYGKTTGFVSSVYITTKTYFKKYTGSSVSIDAALKAVGATTGYEYRAKVAKVNSISNYKGTATQNTKMLNLLKKGKLIKP